MKQTLLLYGRSDAIDPTETWAAQDFRSAKALFVPSLKRDIVPSIACTRPPAGGVAWQSTSDGENSYSHWAARRCVAARSAREQPGGKLPTMGTWAPAPSVESERVAAFVQRLRELAWIDGRNLAIEYRWAEGRNERYAENATEFVRLKLDVIVTSTTPATLAAKQATALIPIVFAAASDPVGTGLVASLARPGGNVTGLVDPDSRYWLASSSNCCARSFPVFAGWRSWLMSAIPPSVLDMARGPGSGSHARP